MDYENSVAARGCGYPAVELNRCGQNETIVVVGMLADEIHAARSAIKSGGRAKAGAEIFQKLESFFQRPILFQIRIVLDRRICGHTRRNMLRNLFGFVIRLIRLCGPHKCDRRDAFVEQHLVECGQILIDEVLVAGLGIAKVFFE